MLVIDPDQYDGFATLEELNLTPEEIQELRSNKKQLTDYGMERIRELIRNQEQYPDAMFEEAERREAANKARAAVDRLYEENGDELKQLAEIEKDEL